MKVWPTTIVIPIILIVFFAFLVTQQYFVFTYAASNLTEYKNGRLGISFEYPKGWPNPTILDNEYCFTTSDSCAVSFSLGHQAAGNNMENFILGVRVNKLNEPSNSVDYSACLCHTLTNFMQWDYNRTYKVQTVINDNQTTIGKNHTAWQMEVINKDNGYKSLVAWVKNGNFGYRFLYTAPNNNDFGYYLANFKQLLNSVNFVTSKPIVPKPPSFMVSENRTSEPKNSNIATGNTTAFKSSNEIIVADTARTPNTEFLTFKDDDIGFKLQYPSIVQSYNSSTASLFWKFRRNFVSKIF